MNMPPRHMGFELIDLDEPGIAVGKCFVPGAGLRIGLQLEGKLVHMSPAGARRMAADFDTPTAHGHDLGWVAEALRQSADEVEAARATKQ